MNLFKLLLKDFSRWLFWYPFRWFMSAIPISLAYKIGDFMAWLIYLINGRRKTKIRSELSKMNLGRQLSEQENQHIVKIGVYMFFWNQLDVLLYPKLMKQPIDFYTALVGEEHLKQALAKGKGVIIAHPHIANAQMLMPALVYRGYPLNQVGLTPEDLKEEMDSEHHIPESLQSSGIQKKLTTPLPPDSGRDVTCYVSTVGKEGAGGGGSPDTETMPLPTPMLERVLKLMHTLELNLPAKFVYLRQSLLPAFRCLKRNELLAIAIDGAGGKNRVFVNLAGRKASFSQGPVAIALREGAPILPLYTLRLTPSYRHRIIIDSPIELTVTGDSEKDIITNTQKIADRISQFISQHPDQYARLLGYKRPLFAD